MATRRAGGRRSAARGRAAAVTRAVAELPMIYEIDKKILLAIVESIPTIETSK
ncbi:MAG: hypothetical protein KDC23_01465 [Actinobacteria bacterium]|nr:hypothetical protein [Actinomycetota bacterium]